MVSYYSDIPRHSFLLRYAMIAELSCGLSGALYLLSPFRFWETPVVPHQSEMITHALCLLNFWLGIIIVRKSISREYHSHLTLPDLVLLFYNIYLILLAKTTGKPIDPEIILGWLALALLYIIFRMTKPAQLKYYLYLLPLALLLQLLYSLNTQPDYFAPARHFYSIRGSFLNTGIWGAFTALTLLICTGSALYTGSKAIQRLCACAAVISLGLLFLSFSRAAWICAFVGLTYLLINRFRLLLLAAGRKVKYGLLLAIIGLFLLLAYSLGQYKTDSANGRLLIWQISAPLMKENPVIGSGIDGFRHNYMERQQIYFSNHPDSRFNRLADDNPFAFNELLKTGIEQGIAGLFFTALLLYFLLKGKQEDEPAATIARAGIIAFFTFGLFSYPTTIFQLNIVLVLLVAILASGHPSVVRANGTLILAGCFVIANGWLCIRYVSPYAFAVKQWNTLLLSGNPANTATLSRIKPYLKNSFLFQTTYGAFLNRNQYHAAAVEALEEATRHYPSYQLTVELGKSYEALGEYDNADRAWQQAAGMVPHKFTPGYLRAKMYIKTGHTTPAHKLANDLLRKKAKRITPGLHLILREMREILQTDTNQLKSSIYEKTNR